jgi:uncharacterized RDD family membrane protein YckC
MIEPLPAEPALPAPPPPAFAGFWLRVLAWLIDGLVIGLLEAPFALPAIWLPVWRSVQESMRTGVHAPIDVPYGWSLLLIAIAYLYRFLMIGRWNATVGKFVVGIRVRRADGSPAGWREAALRPILESVVSLPRSSVLGLVRYVDDVWMLWDRRSQTLHDKVAGTIVVKV